MGDVKERAAELVAELGDQGDDARLDGDVEGRRRLVQKQQRRLRQQRHGDDHPLLLAAGELMGVGGEDPLRVGQAHVVEHLKGAGSRVGRTYGLVRHGHFHELGGDGEAGIQRRHRLLIDHGDFRAPEAAQLVGVQRAEVAALEGDTAADDAAVVAQVPHDGQGHRRLAAARFADQADAFPRLQGQREVLDCRDLAGAGKVGNAEALDVE